MSVDGDARQAAMIGRRSDGEPVLRPLSPHLQVYDLVQMTSALSISHRITGVAWSIGLIFLAWWLLAAAQGEAAFATAMWFFGSLFGILVLIGLSAVAWYHTLAGLRHLVWDAGYGYDLDTVYATGRAVLIGTAVLTALTWLVLLLRWI